MFRRLCMPAVAVLLSALPAFGQAIQDRVLYRDRAQDGKIVPVDGITKESANGVIVSTPAPENKVKATISAADLVRIDYGTVPGVERTAQLAAIVLEDNPDPTKPLAAYSALLKFPGATGNPKAKRYLEFREVVLSAKVANTKVGKDFETEGKAVAAKLVAFSKNNVAGWEAWITARMAARFLCELEDIAGAADAVSILGRNAALAPELRREAKLIEAGYLIRANKRLDAGAIVTELADDKAFPATGPLRERWAIFEEVSKAPLPPPEPKAGEAPPSPADVEARLAKVREATAKIEALIGKAKDPAARAAGYGALGEVYIRHALWREAMWAYLWVDVVYNQDHDEQVKAVNRLVQIFTVLKEKEKAGEGEKDRADTYRDRLPRIRG